MKITSLMLLLIVGLSTFSQDSFKNMEKNYNFKQIIDLSGLPGMESKTTPKFIDGKKGLDSFIANNIKYPKDAILNNIEGIVVMMYIVNTKGKVVKVQTTSDTPEILNNELKRVLYKSEPWIPAKKGEKYFNMNLSLSYEFKLK